MESLQNTGAIVALVITLVGVIKPFIPDTKKDILPIISILIGGIIAFIYKQDILSVIDGILGGLTATVVYKVGSTSTKEVEPKSETSNKDVEEIIKSLKLLKK